MDGAAARISLAPGAAPGAADAPDSPERWIARVFGLEVCGDFPAPGLADSAAARGKGPLVTATVISELEAQTKWPGGDGGRVLHYRYEDGATVMAIDHDAELGYRLFALDQGTHFVSADGASIASAPLAGDSWLWQRYLVGQVLPLAALLNGFESIHASVVSLHGHALAFVGPSGTGKTSLALNLVLRGGKFMADDVAVLELCDGRPVVHPGPGVANLRASEHARIGDARRSWLGRVIGRDAQGIRLTLEREPNPAPLRAMYLLERGCEGAVPVFEPVPAPSFQLLLACRYSHFANTPARLAQQLEAHAAIAQHVRVFKLRTPSRVGAAELSAYVGAHVRRELS